MNLIKRLIPPTLRYFQQSCKQLIDWHYRDYNSPSPSFIKQRVLMRNAVPQGTYVETGTYLGDTTYFLAKRFPRVISLEPEPQLFAQAERRFSMMNNVEIVNEASESAFPKLLPQLNGNINFWLDGHYSGGTTWPTYKGEHDTPIALELIQIEANIQKCDNVVVLVDDVRCFQSDSSMSGYPKLDYLVDWARRTRMDWHIEHDIFVAKRINH
jgi:hypothetical protein